MGIALLRLGDLTRYVSHSVIIGFTVGAGSLLVLDQTKNLLGLETRGHPEDRRDQRRGHGEAKGRREPFTDDLRHQALLVVRPAEVAPEEPPHPQDVLDPERPVEAVVVPDLGDDRGIAPLAHGGPDGVAERERGEEEHEEGNSEEHGDEREEAAADEADHVAPGGATRWARRAGPPAGLHGAARRGDALPSAPAGLGLKPHLAERRLV